VVGFKERVMGIRLDKESRGWLVAVWIMVGSGCGSGGGPNDNAQELFRAESSEEVLAAYFQSIRSKDHLAYLELHVPDVVILQPEIEEPENPWATQSSILCLPWLSEEYWIEPDGGELCWNGRFSMDYAIIYETYQNGRTITLVRLSILYNEQGGTTDLREGVLRFELVEDDGLKIAKVEIKEHA
jgi:hypothetical protein